MLRIIGVLVKYAGVVLIMLSAVLLIVSYFPVPSTSPSFIKDSIPFFQANVLWLKMFAAGTVLFILGFVVTPLKPY